MFVANWYKMLAVGMTGKTNNIPAVDGSAREVESSYLNMNSTNNNLPSLTRFIKGTNGYGGVDFGDGDTPPAMGDYCLSGNSFKTFTATASSTTTVTDEYVEIKTIYSITNNGTDAFTIREVGLFFAHTSTNYLYNTLIERTLLDAPVTIPAGGYGQVTYTIRINFPTA